MKPMKRLTDALFPGAKVFVAGMSGEPTQMFDELRADPQQADGVQFMAVSFPGIGDGDYLGLHPGARQSAFFMTPAKIAQYGFSAVPVTPMYLIAWSMTCRPAVDVGFGILGSPRT